MDCKHARMLLEVAHPLATELEQAETAALASHLADCPDCGPMAEEERRVDEKVGVAMRDVPVPDGLQLRLNRRLQMERDTWWRVRVVRAAGVAAALLFFCVIGYAVWFSKRPVPDLHRLLDVAEQQAYTAKLVEQHFEEKGVVMTAPTDFNYRYLQSLNLTAFEGIESRPVVPTLWFVRQSENGTFETALVYVLSDRICNLDAIRDAPPVGGSRKNVSVRFPNNPHVAFVVVHTGSLKGFLIENVDLH